MMDPDLYHNMSPYFLFWGGGGGSISSYKYALYPQIYLLREPGPDSHIKNTPFLMYSVRTYVSSNSIGPATPQESDVMPM